MKEREGGGRREGGREEGGREGEKERDFVNIGTAIVCMYMYIFKPLRLLCVWENGVVVYSYVSVSSFFLFLFLFLILSFVHCGVLYK